MRPSVVTGGIAGLLLAVVVLGGATLTAANASAATGAARPWVLDALGVAWLLSLLGAFAAGSVLFIAWVAEGMTGAERGAEPEGPPATR
jgi:hypothetical protein